jgi:hypothetical protein
MRIMIPIKEVIVAERDLENAQKFKLKFQFFEKFQKK